MSYGNTWDSNNHLRVEMPSTYDMANGISVVMWIKKTAAEWDSTTIGWAWGFSDDSSFNNTNMLGLSTTNAAADRLTVRSYNNVGSNEGVNSDFTPNLADDIWVPVVGVYGVGATSLDVGSRTVYMKNSSEKGTESSPDSTLDSPGLQYVFVGRAAHSSQEFVGSIGAVAMFTSTLTDADVDKLEVSAETGIALNTVDRENCIAYWNFTDSSEPASWPDLSGNGGPALTIYGTPTFSTSDNPTILEIPNVYINDAPTLDGGEVLQTYPGDNNFRDHRIIMQTAPDLTGLSGQLYIIVKTKEGVVSSRPISVQSSGITVDYLHSTRNPWRIFGTGFGES